ncbi:MAG: LON peptidase substrate-binding domain-containing protein [Chloroflexi bacterium]|nr:LON peptidase substrate-binding domain-containing protein [Chloroflexota bacterium]
MSENEVKKIKKIPVVPLRGGAVFPGITTTISVGRQSSLLAAQTAVVQGGDILILVQYNADIENPQSKDLATIGVLASVRDILRSPHMGVQMLLELRHRVRFHKLEATEPYLEGVYSELTDTSDSADPELLNQAIAYLEQYAEAIGEANHQVMAVTRSKTTVGELADYIAGLLNLPFEVELNVLTSLNGVDRLALVIEYLQQEPKITEIRHKIQQDARANTDKAQREYLLREQMRAIRKELGEEGENLSETLRQKIEAAGMPRKRKPVRSKSWTAWNIRASSRPNPASFALIWNGWWNCPGRQPRKTIWMWPMCARF